MRCGFCRGCTRGSTTGTPIQLMIENTDQRSKDYGDIAQKFRPGHADITYWQKYGIRDPRGGGRSSARETAARVAAGGVARAALGLLLPEVKITGYMVQMGRLKADRDRFDMAEIGRNPFWTPDASAAAIWAEHLDELRKSGNSVGAVVEVVASGVPAGLGAPIYGKLDTDLAAAMMSINAVKGVEIGEGMAAAELTGVENADEIYMGNDGKPRFSVEPRGRDSGRDFQRAGCCRALCRQADLLDPLVRARPSPSRGEETEIVTKGRHDPCVGIRAVPVGEAMMACVILDHFLLHRGQVGDAGGRIG